MMTRTTRNRTYDEIRRAARIGAIGRELDIALRILNPEISRVTVVDSGPAPAWTDFDTVYLNRADLPADVRTLAEIAQWVGAALHELGHTVFTPRPDSPLGVRVRAMAETLYPGAFHAWNVLEDPRVELALVSRFSPIRGYLTAVITALIVDGGSARDAWPLVAGRTYLPATTRAAIRAEWVRQYGRESADDVARIIGEYQTLTDPGDTQSARAATLIMDLVRVLGATVQPPSGCGGTIRVRAGSPVPTPTPDPGTTADTADLGDLGDDTDSGADTDSGGDSGTDPDTDSDSGGDSGTDSDTDSDSGADTDSDSGNPGSGSGADDSDSGADPDSDSGNPGSGSGGSQTDPTDPGDLEDLLNRDRDRVLAAPDVARDLADYRAATDAANAVLPPVYDPPFPTRYGVPTDTARSVRDRLADVLAGMVAGSMPGVILGTDHGRINSRRWATPGAIDPRSLFDRFDPGALDDISGSLVVILDQSGSMSGQAGELSETLWAVAHMARAGDLDLVVVGFGAPGDTVTLFGPDDSTPGERVRVIGADSGSTDPRDALRFALARLTDPGVGRNRVCLMMTDGVLDYAARAESESLVRAMRDQGIATGTYYLGGDLGTLGAEYETESWDLTGLPDLVAQMVMDQVSRG